MVARAPSRAVMRIGKGEAHGRSPVVWSARARRAAVSELPAALEHSIARDRGLPQRDAAVVDGDEAGAEDLEAVAGQPVRAQVGEQPVLEHAAGERDGRRAPTRRGRGGRGRARWRRAVTCSRAPTAPGAAPASRSASTPATSGARRTTAGAGSRAHVRDDGAGRRRRGPRRRARRPTPPRRARGARAAAPGSPSSDHAYGAAPAARSIWPDAIISSSIAAWPS